MVTEDHEFDHIRFIFQNITRSCSHTAGFFILIQYFRNFYYLIKIVVSDSLIIIPTYNEKENVAAIITAVMNLPLSFHVLIIDDGSPDGTVNPDSNDGSDSKGFSLNQFVASISEYDYTRIPLMIFALFLVILVSIVGYGKVKS